MAYEMALTSAGENGSNSKRYGLIASAVWNAHARPDHTAQPRLSPSKLVACTSNFSHRNGEVGTQARIHDLLTAPDGSQDRLRREGR